jgi:hypothetical protein
MNERTEDHAMPWIWRGSALAALVIGWVFITWQNHFHITAPVVFVCLGYLAVVATVVNLWRTGAAAVSSSEDSDDSTWAKPAGALGELEREKRTLLKAIKEAEFDHQMGKLSQHDVDDMIRTYRGRAIEVIKEIDRLGLGAAGSTREQILREVRARIEVEARSPKKPEPAAKAEAQVGQGQGQGQGQGKKAGKPQKKKSAGNGTSSAATAEARAVGQASEATNGAVGEAAVGEAAAGDATPAVAAATPEPSRAAADAAQAAAAQAAIDDESLNADSTTTVEPKRDNVAKEATP